MREEADAEGRNHDRSATDARKEKPMKSPSVIRMLALSVLGLGLVFAASPVTAGVVDLQVNGSGTAGGGRPPSLVAPSSGWPRNPLGGADRALFRRGLYEPSLPARESVA